MSSSNSLENPLFHWSNRYCSTQAGMLLATPPTPPRARVTVPVHHHPRRHPLVVACRDARAGGDDQPLLLDGWHLLIEAARSALDVDAVLVGIAPPHADRTRHSRPLVERGCQVVEVTPTSCDAASPVRTPSGVVALAPPATAGDRARVLATAGPGRGDRRRPGSRQRRRAGSRRRSGRRHRLRCRRRVGRSAGLEGAARGDGQRLSAADGARSRTSSRCSSRSTRAELQLVALVAAGGVAPRRRST